MFPGSTGGPSIGPEDVERCQSPENFIWSLHISQSGARQLSRKSAEFVGGKSRRKILPLRGEYFLILVKVTKVRLYLPFLYRFGYKCLVPIKSENGAYNLISVRFNKRFRKDFCVCCDKWSTQHCWTRDKSIRCSEWLAHVYICVCVYIYVCIYLFRLYWHELKTLNYFTKLNYVFT